MYNKKYLKGLLITVGTSVGWEALGGLQSGVPVLRRSLSAADGLALSIQSSCASCVVLGMLRSLWLLAGRAG